MKPATLFFALGAAAWLAACAKDVTPRDPVVGETTILGPLTGHDAPLHPDNVSPNRLAYYGTDLGFTYEHGGQIHFLFGDTSATEKGEPIQASSKGLYDDSFGTIALADWPDPAKITPTNLPLIRLGQNPGTTEMSAIDVGRPMESFKTPVGGFSNGEDQYGLFYFSKPVACRAAADCGAAFRCDTGLGYFGEPPDSDRGLTFACNEGAPGCTAETMTPADGAPPGGFCTDPTSSAWADTPVGRISGVALKLLVGVRSREDPRRYTGIREWPTSKFANVAARAAGDRVLLWGRPGFVGVKARGRSLGLYFAWADMPKGADFGWKVHYYAGSDADGKPRYSDNEADAVAADLDSSQEGVQPVEPYDIVDHTTVSWVEPLGKWVMFYGGGLINRPTPVLPNCGVLELFARGECKDVDMGNGAIRMRTADDPWGPWSPPQDVLVGGDPNRNPPEAQFAPGGIMRHPDCTQPGCADSTDWEGVDPREYGFLYGVNIIEEWTRPAGDGVDILWNLSTWDPYRVVLARTRINR